MGYELLEALAELLRQAGLQAGEEYPGHQQPAVDSPTAAVGLKELDVPAGLGLTVLCRETEVEGVVSFTARRDRGRRLIGAFCQSEPVGITPGRDGWQLELVQQGDRTPEAVEEPFTLTVRDGNREWVYTGCCWNEERYEHTGQGLRLIRQGFALGREEHDG